MRTRGKNVKRTSLTSWYTSPMAIETPTHSPAELERRREAARSADAHLRLEGLEGSDAVALLCERWERGELSDEALLAATQAHLRREP